MKKMMMVCCMLFGTVAASAQFTVYQSAEEVRLLSVKQQSSWSNCGSVASEVGAFDSEEIRDNFTFKAYSIQYGTVYF